jgi:hypothetical protein
MKEVNINKYTLNVCTNNNDIIRNYNKIIICTHYIEYRKKLFSYQKWIFAWPILISLAHTIWLAWIIIEYFSDRIKYIYIYIYIYRYIEKNILKLLNTVKYNLFYWKD